LGSPPFPHCCISCFILSTVIISAFGIFCKTILQIVLSAKRLAKPFYKSASINLPVRNKVEIFLPLS